MGEGEGTRVVMLLGADGELFRQLQTISPGLDCTVRRYGDLAPLHDSLSRESRPAVVVVDARHALTDGLAMIGRLRESEAVPLILIDDDDTAATAVQVMKNGAIDYLTKPCSDADLSAAVRDALSVAGIPSIARSAAATAEELRRLTRRERDVLNLLLEGMSSKSIARELGISHRTVEVHRSRVMQKMRAGNLAQLISLVHQLRGRRHPGA